MLILYGTRNFTIDKGRSARYFRCQHCGAEGQWKIANVWTWFTLFFIPLFPVWKRKLLMCPQCDYGIKINSKNRELLDAANGFDSKTV